MVVNTITITKTGNSHNALHVQHVQDQDSGCVVYTFAHAAGMVASILNSETYDDKQMRDLLESRLRLALSDSQSTTIRFVRHRGACYVDLSFADADQDQADDNLVQQAVAKWSQCSS